MQAIIDKNKVHIIERHNPTGPILVDIDFRYRPGKVTRFNDDHILELVQIYMTEIKSCLKVLETQLI